MKTIISLLLLGFSQIASSTEHGTYVCVSDNNYGIYWGKLWEFPTHTFKFEWSVGRLVFSGEGFSGDVEAEIIPIKHIFGEEQIAFVAEAREYGTNYFFYFEKNGRFRLSYLNSVPDVTASNIMLTANCKRF